MFFRMMSKRRQRETSHFDCGLARPLLTISKSLDARQREWLKTVLQNHLLTTAPFKSGLGSPSRDEDESEVILAVSHEDCITSLRNVLLETDPSVKVVDTEIAPGLDITGRPTNSKLAKVRFWREEGEDDTSPSIKARVETWGGK